MLELPYTKSVVRLLKIGFISCPTRMVGSKLACIGSHGLRAVGPMCTPYFRSYKFSQNLEGAKRRSQKFHPTFKIGSDPRQANKLLVWSFLREG